jgi:hypothetical protein
MKLLVGTAILCMLATAPVYAQQNNDNKQEEPSKTPDNHADKPASKSPGKPAHKPSKPPKEAPVTTNSASRHQQDQQQKQTQQNEEKEQQKQAKNQEKQQQQADREATNQRHDQNANHGHAETAENAPRGNEGERRIPEDRYRSGFGRAHTFHVGHDHDRDHRFQFGGYWFEYTEAWPSDWNDDDDFYIVEIDGIDYLCDARFPDQRVEVIIAG